MEIGKGMIFKGNANGICFEVIEANQKHVLYRVLVNGSALDKTHIFGRKAFERCNITRIA